MCGIVGIISLSSEKPDIYELLKSIEQRGPDSYGAFLEDNIFLGHRRLAIIDTSPQSAQPMHFNNYVIVFNGAVYNYKEIRKELEEKGYRFFSEGDTEVIIKAYAYWGKECVKHFNGMFALAIWDKLAKKLFLARDRFGIKPLYFRHDNSGFAFSSRLPGLLKNSDRSINPKALHHYMTLHSIVPPPDTIVNGIKKLPQASTMEYDLITNQYKISEPYWHYKDKKPSIAGYDDLKAELLEKLKISVKRRLVSDVEVGVLLSGGLDSTLLLALIKDFQPAVNTFSIGFESTVEEKGDEFYFSDLAARKYQTNHHKILVPGNRLLKAIPHVIEAMSEPMISHDAIAFYLLSQEVSRTIKVVQTGQGADEIFAGYHWYPKIAGEKENIAGYKNYFFERDHQALKEMINPEFINRDYTGEFIQNYFNDPALESFSDIDKALFIDTNIMLVDDPVKRVDNMTMAWGLEARMPFLDHELAEFAAAIPAKYKYPDGGKLILRDIAGNIIPDEITGRPKGYFPVPALRYIRDDFLELLKEKIDSHISRQRDIFKRNYLNKILNMPNENITKLGTNPLWQIAVLEIWLQTNNI
jgi:asparagine synthase (glutamine-hydrolysing)